jgi:hypothetical protein
VILVFFDKSQCSSARNICINGVYCNVVAMDERLAWLSQLTVAETVLNAAIVVMSV